MTRLVALVLALLLISVLMLWTAAPSVWDGSRKMGIDELTPLERENLGL